MTQKLLDGLRFKIVFPLLEILQKLRTETETEQEQNKKQKPEVDFHFVHVQKTSRSASMWHLETLGDTEQPPQQPQLQPPSPSEQQTDARKKACGDQDRDRDS